MSVRGLDERYKSAIEGANWYFSSIKYDGGASNEALLETFYSDFIKEFMIQDVFGMFFWKPNMPVEFLTNKVIAELYYKIQTRAMYSSTYMINGDLLRRAKANAKA
jgi:hypothetical protein